MHWLTLTEKIYEKKITINFDRVNEIRPCTDGTGSVIYYSDTDYTEVKESPEVIVSSLTQL